MSLKNTLLAVTGTSLLAVSWFAWAQHAGHEHMAGHGSAHHQTGHGEHAATQPDNRVLVKFPENMRKGTLTNMRDHVLALAEIQEAMGKGWFEQAGHIAEQRLGMSSLKAHGAHDVAGFMPQAMQAMGSNMHRSASQFAVEVQNSAVTGDLKPALAALAKTTQACVACHAAYRMQ